MDIRIALAFIVASSLLLGGCAGLSVRRQARLDLEQVLRTARSLEGQTDLRVDGRRWRSDCSGFVRSCFAGAGLELGAVEGARSDSESIYRALAERGRTRGRRARVRPGDLAFFHNTWDRNGDHLRDDRFTHVALVERVDDDGTVHLMHYASGRVKRDVVNPRRPGRARDPGSGKAWNSVLRRGRGRVLSGQLLFRWGRPLPRANP